MNKARLLSLFLVFILLVPAIVACQNETPSATVGSNEYSGEVTNTDSRYDPEIPRNVDLEGYKFNFLVGTNVETCPHIFEAQNTDNPVDEAIYRRNSAIEEEYTITIKEHWIQKDSTAGKGAAYGEIQKAYSSQDTLYDAAVASSYDCGTLAQGNMIVNLRDYGYINLDKAWWDAPANDQLTIMGATYFTAGEISYIDDNFTYAIIFNKDLAKAYDMPDFYKLVDDGKWTYDQLLSMSKQATRRDAVVGYSEDDYFGFLGYVDTTWMSFSSIGARVASINESGELALTLYSEKNFDLIEKWTTFGSDEAFVNWQLDEAAKKKGWGAIYQSDKVLFFGATIDGIYKIRDTETDYGFLPWPKYNEEQSTYYSGIAPNHLSLFCIPNIGNDEHIERTSMLVVALAEASDIITEGFYKKNLEGKSVKDEESYKTLEIIFAEKVYDLGFYYNIGTYRAAMFTLFGSGNANFASFYETNEIAAKLKVNDINKMYKEVASASGD